MAIAGYAFGLFTSLSSGANVQAVGVATCSSGTCKLTLQNTGGTSATISSITIGTQTGSLTTGSPKTIDAGQQSQITFTYLSAFAASTTGQVVLSSGSTVPFVATVS